MKKFKVVLVLLAAFVAVGVTFLSTTKSYANPPAPVTLTHPVTDKAFNENPAPKLVGNSQAQGKFIAKEVAVDRSLANKNGILKSADLETWEQHISQHVQNGGGGTEVAKDRMVWVVKTNYPNGIETKGGFFANAERTVAVDAETGRILNVITTGDLQTVHAPWKKDFK